MASKVNSVIIEGNLVRDAELSYSAKGLAILKGSVAYNRSYKDSSGGYANEVSYFDFVVFGQAAEKIAQYARKGAAIRIVGRLKQDRWLDNTGHNRSAVSIVAEYAEIIKQAAMQPQAAQPEVSQPAQAVDEYEQNELDFVPF